MISGLDLAIYQAVFQQKAITEKYIGKVEFEWWYSEVHYSADCTIGIPFDLFDKTITGILQLDDVLSIEQIGEILGMNVIHNPDRQQYKDDAEYDILRMALDNLKKYGMVETGDINYSACKLTDIGREYTRKGRKFIIEKSKTFSLFYDHTSKNHIEAKKAFQSIKGKNQSLLRGFEFLDEVLMKQIAEIQETEVFNLEKGNSFTNPRIDYEKSYTYQLNLFAVLLFDLTTKQMRLVAYEPNTKTINDRFSKWLNEKHKNQILEQFEPQSLESHLGVLSNEYVQILEEQQKEFELFLKEKPETALSIAKDANSGLAYVDTPYFWSNLNDFVSEDTKEIWFFLSEPNGKVLSLIAKLAQSSLGVFIFLVINNRFLDEKLAQLITALIEHSRKLGNNLFIVNEGIRAFDGFRFWVVKNEVNEFEEGSFLITEGSYFYRALHKSEDVFPVSNHKIFKAFVAEDYLPFFKEQIEVATNQEIEPAKLDKRSILSFNKLDDKPQIFSDLQQDEEVLQQVNQIGQIKSSFVGKLKDLHKSKLFTDLADLNGMFEQQEFSNLEPLKYYFDKIAGVEKELFEDYSELYKTVDQFKKKILQEEQRIKDEILAKTYIIDTNVFIEEPEIVSMIDSKHYVIVSNTVINELDSLKQRVKLRDKATSAISALNKTLGKNKRLRTAKANTRILDEDYRQNSPDNRILSVAFMHLDKNPVLLTSDNGLQLKAKSLAIPVVSLKEFLKTIHQSPIFFDLDDNVDYIKIFGMLSPNKSGQYLISNFIEHLKEINPEFNYKMYGFSKAWEFVESLGCFEVSEKQFITLKK